MTREPTEAERHPTLTEHGRAMLRFLREQPRAPIFRNRSGSRLLAGEVERVRAFEREVLAAHIGWGPRRRPDWLPDHVERCYRDVPHYRGLGPPPREFDEIPPVGRADLSRDVARFVPDDAPLDRLLQFATSGTTGHPLLVPSHPVVAASYLAFHKRALRRCGIELRHGRGQVGVVLLGWQERCFTYVSVTPTQDESGLVKLNLHESDWRDPSDRAPYLDALAPELIAGDPISLAELLALPVTCRPRAVLSTAMALTDGLRGRIEERFSCPVLDLYSLNEAGPVGVFDADAGGHVLLQHRLFVEILDRRGDPLPPGRRGEITLTGGFNFCLPLLRYRTGDQAALVLDRGEPVLRDLAGRPPVRFRTAAGRWVNNLEVTHALSEFAIPQFALHQDAGGAFQLRLARRSVDLDAILRRLRELLGPEPSLDVEECVDFGDKVVQYTSDLPGARP